MIKLFLLLSCLHLLGMFVFGQSSAIVFNDFEKGTQNWEKRGTASVSNSKDQAAGGSKSLKVSGRSAFWQGAQLNTTKMLLGGVVYKFTVSVRLAKNEKPDEIKMTMQLGDGDFQTVGKATVNADEWTIISGNFKPSGKETYMLVFIEAVKDNTSYFIDDFKIESLGDGAPEQSGILLKSDFEDKTAQNWFPKGDGVEIFSSNAAGSQSLKVSGRSKNRHGLQMDVSPLLFKGRTYEFLIQVRLVKGQLQDDLQLIIQQTSPKGDISYKNIATTKVTDAEWVTLSGKYTVITSDNNLVVIVAAEGEKTSYFIDNFSVKIP